jgi:hypothetical protein
VAGGARLANYPSETMRSLATGWVLVGALLLAPATLPRAARAQTAAASPAADLVRLDAEAARLRGELERAKTEIAELKRGNRGVRDDYRLRQRMADFESLARRLTETEARIARLRGGATAPAAAPVLVTPTPAPGDGPVELEAKADILQDQARRLAEQADALARSAGQIRSRQLLRRRAGQLEQDPFAALDASKRSMVFRAPTTRSGAAESGSAGKSTDNNLSSNRSGTADTASSPTPSTAGGAQAPAPPPQGTGAPASGVAPMTPNTTPTTPATPATPTATPGPTMIQLQLRALLDPESLASIQKLERAGKPLSDAEALEKAAAVLRQRAQTLDAQARTMRAKTR